MNSGKIVAGRVDGTEIEGSIRGPRGPKKLFNMLLARKKGQVFTLAILCVEEDTGEVT